MAEHTPEPWIPDTVTGKDGRLTGDTAIVGGPDRQFLATVWTGRRRPASMADARLIAAAPELLAACRAARQELVDELEDCTSPGTRKSLASRISCLDRVIARAEGRTDA